MTGFLSKIQGEIPQNCAVILESPANTFYLTGLKDNEGAVIIMPNKAFFLVDFRYFEAAVNTAKGFEVIQFDDLFNSVSEILKAGAVKTVYAENDYISLSRYNTYKQKLADCVISGDGFAGRLLKKYRECKSEAEIEKIKAAQQITDKTFDYILGKIKPGKTEIEIMLDMEFYLRKLGSDGVSFPFIVVSGKNTSLPHGVPTNKPIEKGDFVTMDFGAVVDGYRSDMTRTVAVGKPTDEQIAVYNTVLCAQEKALKAIKPGAICSDIDKVARDYIYENGYKGCFGHGLGHGVGVEIHEAPSLSPRYHDVLKPGMVVTVEPGIYLNNKFGVRIEDMVIITDNGFENITKSPKELIIL